MLRSYNTLRWCGVLLPFVILALWRLRDGPGLPADDYGQYLMHARALVEGRPYSDIGYIYSNYRWGLGPPVSPPGLPLTLAAIYAVVGPNIMVMRLVLFCFAIAFVALAGLYFARHDDQRLGAGVALLVGLSPSIVHNSTQLLTDLPFAAFVWLMIYVVDLPGRLTAGRLAAITTLGIVAAAFRVPAAAFAPALLLFTLLRFREHGWRPLVPVLVWLAGIAALAAVIPLDRLSPIRMTRLLEYSLVDFRMSVSTYWPPIFESHVHPFPWPAANDGFHVFTGLLMAVGLIAWIPRAFRRFGTIFALVYALMLLFLPITEERYSWPLFPFYVFGLLNGVRIMAARFAHASPQRALEAAFVFALILVPPAVAKVISAPREGNLMTEPEVKAVIQAIRDSAPGDSARVIFYKPRSFAWTTGLPTMGAIGGSQECLISELLRARITHLVLGSMTVGFNAVQQQDLWQLQRTRPELFAPLLRTEHFAVFRFRPPARVVTCR